MSRGIQQESAATAANTSTIYYTEVTAEKQPCWKQNVRAFTKLLQGTLYELHCKNVFVFSA